MSMDVEGNLGPPPLRTELPRPPFLMIAIFLILTTATWIPLVVFARARVERGEQPRIHIVQDMGNQPKLKAQDASEVFADGRAMRLPIPGTVARGSLQEDDHFFRGFKQSGSQVQFFDSLPEQVKLTPELLKRGQERFNIYCAVCHGLDGYGNGPVNVRAVEKQEAKWVPAANLHSDTVRARPDGHLFNTTTNGIRNMAGYGSQISTEDRWAIVAYVRALQLSQRAPANAISKEQLDALK
ncbi:MAG TPA: cytochrome c [Tepidisphaeraceae bacterium]|jgi:mono/diheme cytochrome c family protein